MKISEDILYVGVNDHKIDLFEGQFDVPLGMTYNSYLIKDEKIAVTDTVDRFFGEEWLGNIKTALGEVAPDYLIVHHMEPDHSSNIGLFMERYPNAQIVASVQAFKMMAQFVGTDYPDRQLVTKDGDTLSLGKHTLHFIGAPMVHWPEVLMSYDDADKVFFSADAFGKFGANDVEDPEGWACEARRYYFGIVGMYGAQAKAALAKAAAFDIQTICSLHGPVLQGEMLAEALAAYTTWSAYEPENEGVTIAFNSVYGHTKEAVDCLAALLSDKGIKVSVHDLARMDLHEAIEDAFRYDRLVLASTTYNGSAFPCVRKFIDELIERNYQKRKIALIENGTWAPQAIRRMREMLAEGKDLTILEHTVTIRSAMNDETKAALSVMADELAGNSEVS